ncbi:hypothetical protein RSOLAG22IIIB_08773 [Rhizoctonia solani]|uniref:Uncharacterized protein n=1 Tax=Rhizoctonia solani TaxID=456999 RepID=A0A0K6FUI5_9AGAM|nr:hypothetical protein RSOLAG22IIIB_08773 [Rhizoctonia solani]
MTFDDLKWNLSDVLVDYGARFYSINITADKHSIIQDTISMLLSSKGGPPESLSQLSIQFNNKGASHHTNTPPFHPYCVAPLESHNDWFGRLVGGLTAFRISGTLFQWDNMAFSTRLVEFRLDHVTLGFDEMLVSLMRALSSASELRDLKIISVNTYRLQSETSDNITPLSVSFPKLQDLHLQDLHFNTLEILLPIVAPGSHHLTLYFTGKSLHDNLFSDNNGDWQKTFLRRVQIADLPIVLGPIPVHTLMLSQRPGSNTQWLTSNTFCGLLEALPTLKTLKMDHWHFDQILCADLNRRNHPRLPALENLHLTNTIIHKTYSPREMLASHPLQQVILGEAEHTHRGEPSSREPLQESSDIVQWLRGTVPDFRLIDRPYRSPEFCLDEWQLW